MDQLDGSADGGHADDGQPPMTKAQAQRADSLRRAREKRNKKRKRGGGSKKSSIPSRADGKNRKSGSYDFAQPPLPHLSSDSAPYALEDGQPD